MSTFKGQVEEFPDIRIDYFRTIPNVRPPLACFLSHVHSDHLAGLESLKSPFIYCSAATKELLLRLERYPHRINFAQDILEARKQTYKHLKLLLKPIPLETPTQLDLAPNIKIQVTLFDANHCTGAVMFLIEDASHAILYTGDIRSEPWFVNRLTRSPFLVEYSSGLKTLDCMYIDTSNAGDPTEFPTKAEGLKELLEKVSKYPADTTFHLAAWTFGYEEVWMALSRALKSSIHVDKYKLGLYQSLRGNSVANGGKDFSPALSHEGSILGGYKCGNENKEGILTNDQTVRLHSCEKGTACSALNERDVIWIQPIICRVEDNEIAEVGIGGGGGDLTQNPVLELDETSIQNFLQLLAGQENSVVDGAQDKLFKGLNSSLRSLPLGDMGMGLFKEEFTLGEFTSIFLQSIKQKPEGSSPVEANAGESMGANTLPKTIKFPYSRHSSHEELCNLVNAFRPADVYPCTVDEASWHEGISIKAMFGDYCSKSIFRHDLEMLLLHISRNEENKGEEENIIDTQISQVTSENSSMPPPSRRRSNAVNSMSQSQKDPTHSNSQGPSLNRRESPQALHTPVDPEQAVAVTPSSSSQNLRRKAVEEFIQDRAKRVRSSSPADENENEHDGDDDGEESHSTDESDDRDGGNESDVKESNLISFYDPEDDVHRCRVCGWEVWMAGGSCVGCGAGENAYEEHIHPASGEETDDSDHYSLPLNPTLNFVKVGTDSELDPETMAELSEKYLDLASAAYSDEDDDYSDNYEMNSMIDDASIASEESDEPVDWESKFNDMSARYRTLQRTSEALIRQNTELLREIGHAAEYVSDLEDYGEGEIRMIDEIEIQQPEVTEIVLQEPSSEAEVSELTDMSEYESDGEDTITRELSELGPSVEV